MSNRHGERDIKASIRELAVALERGLEDHPAPRELQDFCAGDLSGDERERIESHLAICRDCTRAALDLAEPAELELVKRGELLTEKELAAQWTRFQAAAGISRRRRFPTLRKLAAALLLALLGLGVLTFIREMAQPRTDVAIVDLFPADTRGSEDTVPVSLPPWAGRIALTLNTAKGPVYPEYLVEIRGVGGSEVWSNEIQSDEKGTFVVVVPRRLLPEGGYQIHLSGPGGDPVGDFYLEIGPAQNR